MKKEYKNTVILHAFNKNDCVVKEVILTYDEYYEENCDIIDDNKYRSKLGIIKIHGKIFNYSGELEQEFINYYSDQGKYLSNKIINHNKTTPLA